MATIFSKIIDQEIPSFKVYEDYFTYAFLDIHPKQLGHTLLIPKIEVDNFLDLEEPYLSAMYKNTHTIAKAIQKATSSKKVGIIIEGLEVPHVHFHLIPINNPGDLHNQSLSVNPAAMQQIQASIIENLE